MGYIRSKQLDYSVVPRAVTQPTTSGKRVSMLLNISLELSAKTVIDAPLRDRWISQGQRRRSVVGLIPLVDLPCSSNYRGAQGLTCSLSWSSGNLFTPFPVIAKASYAKIRFYHSKQAFHDAHLFSAAASVTGIPFPPIFSDIL